MANFFEYPSRGALGNLIQKNQKFSRQKRKIYHINSVENNLQISNERRK